MPAGCMASRLLLSPSLPRQFGAWPALCVRIVSERRWRFSHRSSCWHGQAQSGQLSSIAVAGVIGSRIFPGTTSSSVSSMRFPIGKKLAIAAWVIFFTLLVGLPFVRQMYASHAIEVFDSFFRVGSLVFGGGHVVLPLLQTEVVGPGWVTNEQFVAGYGATQAVPGPLFTFAAYLGAVMNSEPNGWTGAFLSFGSDFSSVIPLGNRSASFLGRSSYDTHLSVCFERYQRSCGRTAACRAVQSRLDKRDPLTGGLRPWPDCIWPLDVLEVSPLAGGHAHGDWRRGDQPHLSKPP